MNYKLFLIILLILTTISTVFICVTKPQMHKSVMVYNSDLQISPQVETKISVENIPTVNQVEIQTKSTDITLDDVGFETKDTQINIQTPQFTNDAKFTANTIKQVQPEVKNNQLKLSNNKINNIQPKVNSSNVKVNSPQTAANNSPVRNQTPQIDVQKILENNKKIQTQNQTPKVEQTAPLPQPVKTTEKPVQTASAPVVSTPVKKAPEPVQVLSAKEEEIAWNIWHSNLQNKIMTDVKMPMGIPNGVIFEFSFTVDKYGKITNVKTYAQPSKYTPYAIQYISPVIRSYQGRSILTFPTGSQRVVKDFIGRWKMSTQTKYSSPSDYNDVERIVR